MRACVRALIPRQPLTQNTSEPLILKYRDTDEVLVFVKIILRAERHELRVSPVYRPASRLSVEDRRRMRSEKALRTLNGSSFHRADGAGTHRPKHAQSKSTLSAAWCDVAVERNLVVDGQARRTAHRSTLPVGYSTDARRRYDQAHPVGWWRHRSGNLAKTIPTQSRDAMAIIQKTISDRVVVYNVIKSNRESVVRVTRRGGKQREFDPRSVCHVMYTL